MPILSNSYHNTVKRYYLISAIAFLFGMPTMYGQVNLSEMEPISADSLVNLSY